ncbi:hypothetical protein [Amycolatopsis suaedae]|uniref:Uncharacterized protein n=1 Tax=Amycolatopsis suaedae TaxID=2510978 RepID=A0A4V2EM08_9PSEU|nr:hypothetical protein [Amycolatopsis suaedae]RZQ63415.1 hypothetical protein EWH70_13290 [Amycolatopsis suaedae]
MSQDDRQFMWITDGAMSLGTFADYASQWEDAYYSGADISTFVWTIHNSWELRMHRVNVSLKPVSDERLRYTLTAFNVAQVRIVGRG